MKFEGRKPILLLNLMGNFPACGLQAGKSLLILAPHWVSMLLDQNVRYYFISEKLVGFPLTL